MPVFGFVISNLTPYDSAPRQQNVYVLNDTRLHQNPYTVAVIQITQNLFLSDIKIKNH